METPKTTQFNTISRPIRSSGIPWRPCRSSRPPWPSSSTPRRPAAPRAPADQRTTRMQCDKANVAEKAIHLPNSIQYESATSEIHLSNFIHLSNSLQYESTTSEIHLSNFIYLSHFIQYESRTSEIHLSNLRLLRGGVISEFISARCQRTAMAALSASNACASAPFFRIFARARFLFCVRPILEVDLSPAPKRRWQVGAAPENRNPENEKQRRTSTRLLSVLFVLFRTPKTQSRRYNNTERKTRR